MITVAVSGAAGRMGREVVRALSKTMDLKLVAAIDMMETGEDAGKTAGIGENGVLIGNSLADAFTQTKPQIMIDFSVPSAVLSNALLAIDNGISPVIGATGLSEQDLQVINQSAGQKGIPAFVAPNFAIGAVLMMQFSVTAARYLPDVEVIEMHHDRKVDSPSGTALLTAQRIGEARLKAGISPVEPPANLVEKAPGARGASSQVTGNVPVHSVRLPGFVASQEVIFGGPGQTLTLRHDSLDRLSFMPGVVLAAQKVLSLPIGLTIGLEALLV